MGAATFPDAYLTAGTASPSPYGWLVAGVATTLGAVEGSSDDRSGAPRSVTDPTSGAPRPSDPGEQTAGAVDESASLVARARAGERGAFRTLFDRHRADVARLVYRMVGPRAELEDLLQEVFVQVHRSLKEFRGESRFSTWLHRVTVNVVLMHRRAARSRPVLAEELPAGSVEDVASTHPDDEADRRSRIAAFFALLEGISEKKRIVFVLHDLEGMAPSEIATIVDAPVLTVRTRLFYARRELEEQMRAHPLLANVMKEQGGFGGGEGETGARKRKRSEP
jgi:RNA polymerase sigma-70 factor (ECF subfamily)